MPVLIGLRLIVYLESVLLAVAVLGQWSSSVGIVYLQFIVPLAYVDG